MATVMQAHLKAGVAEAQAEHTTAQAARNPETIAEAERKLADAQNRFAAWDHHRLGLRSLEAAQKTLLKTHGDCEVCKAWNGEEVAVPRAEPARRSLLQRKT